MSWLKRARGQEHRHEGGGDAQSPDQGRENHRKLRGQGESKEKAARIANATAASSPSKVGRKGGKSGSYDDWSKQDLMQRAKEIGIKGRSTMSQQRLIKALRDRLIRPARSAPMSRSVSEAAAAYQPDPRAGPGAPGRRDLPATGKLTTGHCPARAW